MPRRTSTVWLMTVALLIPPLGVVFPLIYGAGRLAVRKRCLAAADPCAEWPKLRDLVRSRGTRSSADPRSPVRM
jgi:hypothetical protein